MKEVTINKDKLPVHQQPQNTVEMLSELLTEIEESLNPLLLRYVDSVVQRNRHRVIETGVKIMGELAAFYLTIHEHWVDGKLRDPQARLLVGKLNDNFDEQLSMLFAKHNLSTEGLGLKFGAMGEAGVITALKQAFPRATAFQCSEEHDKHGADIWLDTTFQGRRVCVVVQVKLLKAGNNPECLFFDQAVADRWGMSYRRMLQVSKQVAGQEAGKRAQVVIPIYIGLPMSPNHLRAEAINRFSSLPGEAVPVILRKKINTILSENIDSPELQL